MLQQETCNYAQIKQINFMHKVIELIVFHAKAKMVCL